MMMTRTLMLLLFIVSCLWQVSRSVVLTPRNISACPGDEIVVKCNESDTAAMIGLRWILTFKNKHTPAAEMTLPDTLTANESSALSFIAEQQLIFLSKLTSYFPLISTFMTTAHPALNDTRLTCRSTLSMDTLTIRIAGTNQPEIQWLNITGRIFEEENLTAVIKWESNSGCLNFTLILSNDTSINYNITSTTTKNTSHTFEFNILYNTNYTVTVSSSSGNNSSEISKTFNFVKCEPPPHRENVTVSGYVSPALENTQISLSCPPGYGLPNREVATITSTCTSEATWSPDLSLLDLECKPSRKITVTTLGAVTALLCIALLGTCGALFAIAIIIKYKKSREGKRTQDQAIDVVPGSGILTPNVCYELTEISQKRRLPDDRVEVERNPAYATLSPVSESSRRL